MRHRPVWQIIVSLAVGVVFLALAFRNVSVRELSQAIAAFRWPWLLAAVAVSITMMLLRAWRWQLELRPLGHIALVRLWPITAVAYSAINVIPARLGEVVRPWLLAKFTHVRLSQAMGALVVEKLVDSFCILVYMLAALLLVEQLPTWARSAALFPLVFSMGFAAVVVLAWQRGESFVAQRVVKLLPEAAGQAVVQVVHAVLEGMQVLPNTRLLLRVFAASLVLWALPILSSWIVIQGFAFPVPFTAALLVFLFVGLATALPNPPGMIGPFQYACILALGIYGVEAEAALAFGLVLNALQLFTIVAQGIVGAVVLGMRWSDVRAAAQMVGTAGAGQPEMLASDGGKAVHPPDERHPQWRQ